MKPKPVPKPPTHLSQRTRKLWRELVATYVFQPADLELLRVGLEALDRCDDARKTIKAEGAVYTDRFGQPKQHPATRVEVDNRAAWVRIARELNLDSQVPESRPPLLRGRYADRR